MDLYAMWIGYAVMVACGLAVASAAVGLYGQRLWRRLLRDVPNMNYIAQAIAHFKTVQPPPTSGLRETDD